MDPHYYSVQLNWTNGRIGVLSSDELDNTLQVATPQPFKGGLERIWSPEHLLTAAVNSCFMTTFLAIAENSNLEFVSFSCASRGKLEQLEGKYLITEVFLFPELKVKKKEDEEKALRILMKSEAACLISNSIKAKVTMQPLINSATQ
jgi:peroxiredoxin-like protein